MTWLMTSALRQDRTSFVRKIHSLMKDSTETLKLAIR